MIYDIICHYMIRHLFQCPLFSNLTFLHEFETPPLQPYHTLEVDIYMTVFLALVPSILIFFITQIACCFNYLSIVLYFDIQEASLFLFAFLKSRQKTMVWATQSCNFFSYKL